jgi:pyruvate dehydrogenase E2 component (dihydrolipoamide acetyltransferase)
MATTVVMPQLGNTVESCLLAAWHVAVGDTVDAGTILCDIETDKSSMEVPAGVAGTVLALLAAVDDDIPVKDPIAIIGAPGEAVDVPAPAQAASPEPAAAVTPAAPETAAPVPAPPPAPAPAAAAAGPALASPRAKGLAGAQGLDATTLAGSGPDGLVIERDVKAALTDAPGLTRAAQAAGGTAPAGPGTALGGRTSLADLAAPAAAPPAAAGVTAPGGRDRPFPGPASDTRLMGVRQIIADRMMASLAGSAQLTYTATAPAAALLNLRARFKNSDPAWGLNAVTIGDLVGYAFVQTLARHPGLNAHLEDGVWRVFDHVHLAVAVDTPRGLLVPVVRHADTLTLTEFAAESKRVAQAALAGSIDPDRLSGGTITVSNLGAFGIESFTPILNAPQVAILGVNAIVPRATLRPDGSPGVEQVIAFSLTADHRVLDGADAARFLQDLCRAVRDLDLLLATGKGL